jgi:hypothetical protein
MGPQRLKFYIGLLPGVRQLKFRYYYEEFGDILIPAVGVGLPGPIQAPLQVPAQPPAPDPIKQPLSPPEQEAQDSLVGSELAVSPALLALAQAGDLAAIATLLNQGLQPRGVRAKIRMRGNTLKVLLEAPMLPKQSRFAPMVYRGVIKLKIQSVYQLQVHGRHIGEKEPAWSETFFLRPD